MMGGAVVVEDWSGTTEVLGLGSAARIGVPAEAELVGAEFGWEKIGIVT